MKTDFQLEHFVLTKMHVDWIAPANEATTTVEHVESMFSCRVLRNQTLPRQFKVEFSGRFSQRAKADVRIGFQVDAHLAALATVSDTVSEEKLHSFVHANAVNVLYGTMRGLVASATGVFPFGPLILPSISPKEILSSIQTQPSAAASQRQTKGRPAAQRAASPAPVPAAARK